MMCVVWNVMAIPVQVRDLPVDKHRLRTLAGRPDKFIGHCNLPPATGGGAVMNGSWRAQHWVRMVHRALQLCRRPTGGCSVERLKGGATLSADGHVLPLSPWLACQPEGRLNMSWWSRSEGAHAPAPRIGLVTCDDRQHLSWGGDNPTSCCEINEGTDAGSVGIP